jgi:hypothetical protein
METEFWKRLLHHDIVFFQNIIFGENQKARKNARNPVKSMVLSNLLFAKSAKNQSAKNVFGENSLFLAIFLAKILYFWRNRIVISRNRRYFMRKKGYRGTRVEKRTLSKSKEVCRLYDAIQSTYADILQECADIKEIRCNVLLDGFPEGEYTSDFVCVRSDGDLMVRECTERKYLTKPKTVKLLDASRDYWLSHGVVDWGLVIDAEK